MNMRIAGLVLLLIAVPAAGQQHGGSAEGGAAGRATMLATLERGKEMKGSGAQYRHLPQAAAVALSGDETPEQALARIGEAGAQLLETKGKLVLFRSAQARQASLGQAGGAIVYPAVVSARSGTLGVLTGQVVVRPKSMAEADAIASAHGLEKVKAYPQLQAVFYKVKSGADIADASAALQADPRVESAYPEIIERVRVPR
jgi:hypothetical protein